MFQNQPEVAAASASAVTVLSMGSHSTEARPEVTWRGPIATLLAACMGEKHGGGALRLDKAG